MKPPGIGPRVLVCVYIYHGKPFWVPVFDPHPFGDVDRWLTDLARRACVDCSWIRKQCVYLVAVDPSAKSLTFWGV